MNEIDTVRTVKDGVSFQKNVQDIWAKMSGLKTKASMIDKTQ